MNVYEQAERELSEAREAFSSAFGGTENAVAAITMTGASTEKPPEPEAPDTEYELLSNEELEALFDL